MVMENTIFTAFTVTLPYCVLFYKVGILSIPILQIMKSENHRGKSQAIGREIKKELEDLAPPSTILHSLCLVTEHLYWVEEHLSQIMSIWNLRL